MNKKLMLVILDGFGLNPTDYGNAISAAKKPTLDKLFAQYPSTHLKTNGLDVGLPIGIMGNSEVGHLNIGAGRVVYQLNTMIDKAVLDGSFFQNTALLSAIDHALTHKSKLHLFGLLSDGGVHSSLTHLWALLELCKQKGLPEVYYHAFMDGRDTLPHSGINFMQTFLDKSKEIGIGKVASVSGRYYAMDRDNRWERIDLAYKALVNGEGEYYEDPILAIQASYDKNLTDEFIHPKVMMEKGNPVATIQDDDSIIFFNFRADRTRQLTRCFIMPDFKEIPVTKFNNLKYVSMTEYDIKFAPYLSVGFYAVKMDNILGKVIQDNHLKQLRIAETEKYAHVTFFFNGGVEQPFEGEDRTLIPSPKIPSYDLQPEMSAFLVKDKLVETIKSNKYDLIIVNFANCDMVGHTGFFGATMQAVETVDACMSEVIPAAQQNNYNILLTADHGNAEQMLDEEGNIFTAHSMNEVPILFILQNKTPIDPQPGVLADIAPTILKIMQVTQPPEMTGKSLI